MKIHGWQGATVWHDREANYRQLRQALQAAPPSPGDLLVLPEMFATGFSFKLAATAEEEEGPTETFAREMAREYQIYLIVGWTGRHVDGRGRNIASVLGPDGGVILRYDKVHPFSFAGEDQVFAGGEVPGSFVWQDLPCAVAVCYDLRFPELFRRARPTGVELFVVIANWPAARKTHWEVLLRARAIENQAYVLGVNRTGEDPKVAYAGGSLLIDPQGRTVVDAGEKEGLFQGVINRAELREYREKFPALRDRKLI